MNHKRRIKLILVALFVGSMWIGFSYAARRPDIGGRFIEWSTSTANRSSVDSTVSTEPPYTAEIEYASQIDLDRVASDGDTDADTDGKAPVLPADRPDWVAMSDDLSGDVHSISVGGNLESSSRACREHFDTALVEAVRKYIERYVDDGAHAERLADLPLDPHWIRSRLAKKAPEFEAVIERPSGTYYQQWTRLSITPDDRRIMESWIKQLDIGSRVADVGTGAGACVFLMGLLHVWLRVVSKKPSANP